MLAPSPRGRTAVTAVVPLSSGLLAADGASALVWKPLPRGSRWCQPSGPGGGAGASLRGTWTTPVPTYAPALAFWPQPEWSPTGVAIAPTAPLPPSKRPALLGGAGRTDHWFKLGSGDWFECRRGGRARLSRPTAAWRLIDRPLSIKSGTQSALLAVLTLAFLTGNRAVLSARQKPRGRLLSPPLTCGHGADRTRVL